MTVEEMNAKYGKPAVSVNPASGGASELEQLWGVPKQEKPGFFKSLAQDAAKTLIATPVTRTAQLAATVAEPFLSPENQMKARQFATSEHSIDYPGIGQVTVPAPGQTTGEVAKDVTTQALKSATYLAPYGKIAAGISGVASKVLPAGVSTVLGKSVSTGAGGYASDVANNLDEGKTGAEMFKPGMGAVVGASIPLVGPAVKGVGKLAQETLGLITGTGAGVIGKIWDAALEGGPKLKAFKEGLGTDADTIVNEAKDALDTVVQGRNNSYREQLSKVKSLGGYFKIDPVKTKFNTLLDQFGVEKLPDGQLDFSRSPGLGRYEKDINNINNVISSWGSKAGDNTIVGVDKLKQVLDDFRIGSSDSRKFDAFVTGLRDTAKNIPGDNPEYKKLLTDYQTSTESIKEIQKALSLGDKASVDTAFRKLTSAFRVNNEFRAQMVKELDDASGGYLSSKIAGQQMSEIMPRGLVSKLGAGGAALAAGQTVGMLKFLPAAMLASPYAVQAMLRGIGIPSKVIGGLFNAIENNVIYRSGGGASDGISGSSLVKPVVATGVAGMAGTASAAEDKNGITSQEDFMKQYPDGVNKKKEEPVIPVAKTPDEPVYKVREGKVKVSDNDLEELGAILFGEVGNRNFEKMLLEAKVIANIALNRAQKEGKTLREVLRAPKQFQALNGKQYNLYKTHEAHKNATSTEKIKAIEKVLEEIKKGTLANTVGDNLSYAHRKDETIRVYKDWNEQKKDLNNIK